MEKLNGGKRLIKKFRQVKPNGDWWQWERKIYQKFYEDDISTEEAKNKVHEMIKVRREYYIFTVKNIPKENRMG